MFKRLLILSFGIAFVLAFLTMWLWYLPKQDQEMRPTKEFLQQTEADSVEIAEPPVPVE